MSGPSTPASEPDRPSASTPASEPDRPSASTPASEPDQPFGPASGPVGASVPGPHWGAGAPVPSCSLWLRPSDPGRKVAATPRVLLLALLTGLLTSWLLNDGLGANLLVCAAGTAAAAGLAARAAGRRIRPWTVVWSLLAAALLVVPALWEAGWPVTLAVVCALGLASLALHGGRRWPGVLLPLPAILWQLPPGVLWLVDGLRGRSLPGRGRIVPVFKALAVAAVLLTVFGVLFAGADAAMADLLSGLSPSLDLDRVPLRFVLFVLGALTALGFAHIAAGPRRWDRTVVRPGRARGRLEWALPLVALNLMFGVFAVIQAVVVLGGADAVLRNTGMSRSEYARQGFWQLSAITVLTLAVVAVAKRWAPRATPADRRVARILLGALCLLALVVVASALGRMWFYVDASGLTRLRLWVLVVEGWLGVVFLLLITAGLTRGAGWLPRAVLLSGMLSVAAYGLAGPDAIIAEQNVSRYERALAADPQTARIDLRNVRDLSADAVPALDRLPGAQRTCALQVIAADLADHPKPWYAAGASAARAREILAQRPAVERPTGGRSACEQAGMPFEDIWY
ncbi:DUF4153 domain-containing protein [Kitasatospora sp. NPDC048538]|uniref:DUF4153 domain-containing protein n=1 Tax=unclassified Kitasatospora TaxID=2633591 RepID=UPI0033CF22D5